MNPLRFAAPQRRLASRKKLPHFGSRWTFSLSSAGALTCSEVRGEPLLLLCVVESLRGGGIAAATILVNLLAEAAGRAATIGLDAGARDRVNAAMTKRRRGGGVCSGRGERVLFSRDLQNKKVNAKLAFSALAIESVSLTTRKEKEKRKQKSLQNQKGKRLRLKQKRNNPSRKKNEREKKQGKKGKARGPVFLSLFLFFSLSLFPRVSAFLGICLFPHSHVSPTVSLSLSLSENRTTN